MTIEALGGDLDILDAAGRRRNGEPFFSQTFDMKRDRPANFALDFGHSRARRHASRKIRNICREIAFSLFDDDCVTHATSLRKTGLPEDALDRARREIVARLAGHRDAARFARMLQLTMAPPRANDMPPVGMEDTQDFGDLHGRISARAKRKNVRARTASSLPPASRASTDPRIR